MRIDVLDEYQYSIDDPWHRASIELTMSVAAGLIEHSGASTRPSGLRLSCVRLLRPPPSRPAKDIVVPARRTHRSSRPPLACRERWQYTTEPYGSVYDHPTRSEEHTS